MSTWFFGNDQVVNFELNCQTAAFIAHLAFGECAMFVFPHCRMNEDAFSEKEWWPGPKVSARELMGFFGGVISFGRKFVTLMLHCNILTSIDSMLKKKTCKYNSNLHGKRPSFGCIFTGSGFHSSCMADTILLCQTGKIIIAQWLTVYQQTVRRWRQINY